MDFKDFAPWVQTGGLLAFAWVVWHELKTQRTERNAHDENYSKQLMFLRETMAIIKNILEMSMSNSQKSRARSRLAEDTLREKPREDEDR